MPTARRQGQAGNPGVPGQRAGGESHEAWRRLSEEVTRRRIERGLSQKQLAQKMGISEAGLSTLVNCKKAWKEEFVAQAAAALDAGEELTLLYEEINERVHETGGFTPDQGRQISAALHPFLIRTEIRLSTVHRTAACLLGGAAIMLLLPLFFPTAPATLLGAVLDVSQVSVPSAALLALAMGIAVGLPIWGFILIVADLIGFFFAGNRLDLDASSVDDGHGPDEIAEAAGAAVFSPRLALPGLRAPAAEMPVAAYEKLRDMRKDLLGVLLPEDREWRQRFDDRMRRIFHLEIERDENGAPKPLEDSARMGYAFRLAASTPRTLLEETAKAELLLTKHVLLLRIGQLRFFKTLLLVPVTVLTVIAATSLVTTDRAHGDNPAREMVELIAVFLLWGPLAVGAVGSPNRWIFRMSPMKSKGGRAAAGRGPEPSVKQVYDDPRMVRFENGTVFLAMTSAVLLLVAAAWYGLTHPHTPYTDALLVIGPIMVILWVATKILWWKGRLLRTPQAFFRMLKVGAH